MILVALCMHVPHVFTFVELKYVLLLWLHFSVISQISIGKTQIAQSESYMIVTEVPL